VFENRVLRRIFELKRDEVIGEWRKMHNEGLHDLYYSSPSITRIIKWGRRGARIGYWWETRRKEAARKTKT
jgi:hypothetical protein